MELLPIILIFAGLMYYMRLRSRATVPAKSLPQSTGVQTAPTVSPATSANIAPTPRSTNGVPDAANWTNPLSFTRSLGGGAVYDPTSNIIVGGTIFSNAPPLAVPPDPVYVQPTIPPAVTSQPVDIANTVNAAQPATAPTSPISQARLNSYQLNIRQYLTAYRSARGF